MRRRTPPSWNLPHPLHPFVIQSQRLPYESIETRSKRVSRRIGEIPIPEISLPLPSPPTAEELREQYESKIKQLNERYSTRETDFKNSLEAEAKECEREKSQIIEEKQKIINSMIVTHARELEEERNKANIYGLDLKIDRLTRELEECKKIANSMTKQIADLRQTIREKDSQILGLNDEINLSKITRTWRSR